MNVRQSITLAVTEWSAWAPGLEDRQSWFSWAAGSTPIAGQVAPDVAFVKPMLRRRLSPLSRMAFRVAADIHSPDDAPVSYVFCSRYGEYHRSFALLEQLVRGEPASAAAFSMSVHNTAGSLFALERGDTAPSTAIANCEASLEGGFVEAWTQLEDGAADTVLLVYHDEPLPDIYRDQEQTIRESLAIAMRLKCPAGTQGEQCLTLGWTPSIGSAPKNPVQDPALLFAKLLLNRSKNAVVDTGRLQWDWSTSAEPS